VQSSTLGRSFNENYDSDVTWVGAFIGSSGRTRSYDRYPSWN